jgi:putative flavoprotein involved in K+ transport
MNAGVRLVGRAVAAEGTRVRFADDLLETLVAADVKLARLRMRIDAFADAGALALMYEPEPFERIEAPPAPTALDLRAEGIRTVVWATGYRRLYPWLHVPVLDAHGEIRHEGGVTPLAGLYVMGLRFLRRRKSSFIDGQAQDAPEIADHIVASRRGAQRFAVAR